MNKQIPNYLRLVTDTSLQPTASENEDLAALRGVCRAFERSTGWRLEYSSGAASPHTNLMWSAPVNPGVGTSPGHIRLFTSEDATPNLSLEQATPLAEAIGRLWGEVLLTRRSLAQREAELAAGVPLVVRQDDPRAPSLSQRLEAVLKGGAEAIGCQAAALYLLDAGTTELKLRSSWGLPQRRLTEPARPLRPALADLEALLGHAVVMSEPALFDYWKVPEPGFRSAVCVPISSPSMPLGTLWIFSDRVRDFTDAETNIAEVVAGRLAADLERETLVEEAVATRARSRSIELDDAAVDEAAGDDAFRGCAARDEVAEHEAPWAVELEEDDPLQTPPVAPEPTAEMPAVEQTEQLPAARPMVEGWDVAARACHSGSHGGTFYDWFALDDGSLSVVAGDMREHGVAGALTASLVRGAARAFGTQRRAAHEFAQRASDILWASSAGDAPAGLVHAILEPGAGVLEFCSAGPLRMMAIGVDSFVALEGPSAALGLQESVRLASRHHPMTQDELILAYGTTFLGESADGPTLAAFDQRLALALEPYRGRPLSELLDVGDEILSAYLRGQRADRLLLMFRRRRS